MIGDPDASMHLNQDGLDLLSLKTLCELQQAQIKGLVAALNEAVQAIENLRTFTFDSLGHLELRQNSVPGAQSTQALKLSEKALSTLPAEFLEKERKRDAVIRAAKAYKDERDIDAIMNAVAALETSP